VKRESLGVALIGTGFMGKAHSVAYSMASSLLELPYDFEKVVVCDVTEELASQACSAFGFEEWDLGWKAVIERDDVDIVDIVTPNDLHEEIACAALAAGKHVLCEKPLAPDLAGARRMAAAAESAPGKTMVGFNHRRTAAVVFAKELIDRGEIGDVLQFRGRYLQDWALSPDLPHVWRFERARAGSGALGDIGSHIVECAEYLLGPISRVMSTVQTFVTERPLPDGSGSRAVDVDDAASFLAEFDSGVVGTFTVGRFSAGRKNQLAFEVDGTSGSVAFDWERLNELRVVTADGREHHAGVKTVLMGPAHPQGWWPIPGINTGYVETTALEVAELGSAIVEKRGTDADFAQGLQVEKVIDALLRSAEIEGWVAVDDGRKNASNKE